MSYYKYGRETEFDEFSSKNLQRKAIAYDRNDVGKLKISSNESLRHFVAKSVLVFELLKMKHRIYCEADMPGVGRLDVFDQTVNAVYELESEKSIANINKAKEKYKQANIDLIIIQINHMPMEIDAIREFMRAHIRPD